MERKNRYLLKIAMESGEQVLVWINTPKEDIAIDLAARLVADGLYDGDFTGQLYDMGVNPTVRIF